MNENIQSRTTKVTVPVKTAQESSLARSVIRFQKSETALICAKSPSYANATGGLLAGMNREESEGF